MKPGDVVYYSDRAGIAILDAVDCIDPKLGARWRLTAWRSTSKYQDRWIVSANGRLHESQLELHEAPDKIIAEFAAWRLTHV